MLTTSKELEVIKSANELDELVLLRKGEISRVNKQILYLCV